MTTIDNVYVGVIICAILSFILLAAIVALVIVNCNMSDKVDNIDTSVNELIHKVNTLSKIENINDSNIKWTYNELERQLDEIKANITKLKNKRK